MEANLLISFVLSISSSLGYVIRCKWSLCVLDVAAVKLN